MVGAWWWGASPTRVEQCGSGSRSSRLRNEGVPRSRSPPHHPWPPAFQIRSDDGFVSGICPVLLKNGFIAKFRPRVRRRAGHGRWVGDFLCCQRQRPPWSHRSPAANARRVLQEHQGQRSVLPRSSPCHRRRPAECSLTAGTPRASFGLRLGPRRSPRLHQIALPTAFHSMLI